MTTRTCTPLTDPPTSDRPSRIDDGVQEPFAWSAVLAIAAVKVLLNALVASRYGWHRDELYYADAGRHLAAGFVDLPPITAVLAALARVSFADSLEGLRFLASISGAAVVLVTAALCRDLGGGRRAQVLAAVAISPLLLGANAMFQTVSFDQLTWALVVWATARLLLRPTDRAWWLLGAACGVAWETKYTVALLFSGLIVGFAGSRRGRSTLRARPVAGALAIVAVLAAPNLWWQVTHGWPSVSFLTGRSHEVRDEYPPLRFVIELVVIVGLPTVPLVVHGIVQLCRDEVLRALGIALAVVVPLSLLLGGKSYYAAPLAIGAIAAGAASLQRRTGGWAGYGRALPWVVVATVTAASPLVLPVLPQRLAVSSGIVNVRDDYASEIGWPHLAAEVADTWRKLPKDQRDHTVVVAANYGVAGALERFGPDRGLGAPVISGHLTWSSWSASSIGRNDRSALAVGFDSGTAPTWCRHPRLVGRLRSIPGVDTEEAGTPVWSCRLDVPASTLATLIRRTS